MTKLTFIGDVHAAYNKLNRICADHSDSYIIQVGDLGLGFANGLPNIRGLHFIRGNHDKPKGRNKIKSYLGDYGYLERFNLYYISGAHSTDWKNRIPEYDWWSGEELNNRELDTASKEIAKIKPSILVTHDCPFFLTEHFYDNPIPSRTATWIAKSYKGLWVFGHHHGSFYQTIGDIHFVGLASLETYTIEV